MSWGDWGFIDTPEVQHRLAMAWDEWADKVQHDPPGNGTVKNRGWYYVDHDGIVPKGMSPRFSDLTYFHHPDKKRVDVDLLQVDPDFQKDGVGEALIRRLHGDYPDHKINPGSLSPDGQAFYLRMLEKEPAARDLVTAQRLAALNNSLVDRLRGEFHDWWFSSQQDGVGRSEGLRYWPNIEDFLQDKYPAAYKGLDMGREQVKPALDAASDLQCPDCSGSGYFEEDEDSGYCYGCDGGGQIEPGRQYETGPEAISTYGYDPKETAAGMLLLHNESHGPRRNYLEEDTNRLMDIAQKRYKMQRDYESRTARRQFLAMAWEDYKDKIQGGCGEGCAYNRTEGRYVIPQAGAFLNYEHAFYNDEPQLWVSGIYTHPQNRNDGVAEALMRRLVEDHPGVPISPGVMTGDGQKFHDRMLEKDPSARDLVTAAVRLLHALEKSEL